MKSPFVHSALRYPRARDGFLDCRHCVFVLEDYVVS
jgi:hypothetical protein